MTLDNSLWISSTTFGFYHSLSGSSIQTSTYDVNVHSAVDLAGNIADTLTESNFLTIETVLSLFENTDHNILIYPTILESGGQITIVDKDQSLSNFEFVLINSIGQKVAAVDFELQDGKLVSDRIDVAPGMYYLSNQEINFKIIVQ